ncbi:MAG TPA: Rid family detoxifying hydrolase [Candidatus Eisenbacteria bacterium]|nr:Rid family detoxifying hydrolase [Candidatus Eisenbacteria bacterium]
MSQGTDRAVLHTDRAPAAIGPYVQARTGTLQGRWIVTSGQTGTDPSKGALVPGGVAEQTEQTIRNLEAILAEGGATLANVVKTTVFLVDMADFKAMNEVYASRFTEPRPARSTIAARDLPAGARVEIEVWAFLP